MVENPSSYLRFVDSTMPECQFVAELSRRAGCGILLDVNNIYPERQQSRLRHRRISGDHPGRAVGELHVAGFTAEEIDGVEILIDAHGSRVEPPVWELLDAALARFGPHPVLVEWDNDIPALSVLLEERDEAQRRLDLSVWSRPMPALREVQAAFAAAVLGGKVDAALTERIVAAGLSPERRLGVYRTNVVLSLRRLLEGTFPACRRLLGADRFAGLADRFVRRAAAGPAAAARLMAPSSRPSWRLVDPLDRRCRRLEWAREESYHAADAPSLNVVDAGGDPGRSLLRSCASTPHPSLRLVRSAGPVYALWADEPIGSRAAAGAGRQARQ